MNVHPSSNPVSLSYVAALRGVAPRKPGTAFAYADLACVKPELLTCIAASNPEGKFYGVVATENMAAKAAEGAKMRDVGNIEFIAGNPQTVLAQLVSRASTLPPLNYLCCDESEAPLGAADRKALFDVAEKLLQPGGLLHYSYRAYDRDDGHLRFLVRELAPEMTPLQAKEFLGEAKALGGFFLKKHPEVAATLKAATAAQDPAAFFTAFRDGDVGSGSFDTIVALHPRGFAFAGTGDISANYIELSVPQEAQDVIVKCAKSALYEAIKDYAFDRTLRSDVWVRQPVTQSASLAELFGSFTYGITVSREEVPASFTAQGKQIDLSSPLFKNLIELMTLTPMGIGDFLAHPKGLGFSPTEVVGAMQILVACGIAQPMRGVREQNDVSNVEAPRLVGGFNRYLDKMPLTGSDTWMASPVLGGAIALSPRDALVMQALGRAGLANSVSALLPELERLAKNPAEASRVMDASEPTAEIARDMIQEVVSKSIIQWYAYGLLEAA